MNPNQMMIAKAMVAQTALREEAAESRCRRTNSGPLPDHPQRPPLPRLAATAKSPRGNPGQCQPTDGRAGKLAELMAAFDE